MPKSSCAYKKMSVLYYIFEKNIDKQILKDFSGFSLCKKAKLPTECQKVIQNCEIEFQKHFRKF